MQLCDLKKQKEDKVDALIRECLMFFAFSDEQFVKNKTPLQEGEIYVSLGAGAYMPKGKVKAYLNGMKEIKAWYKKAVNESKLRRENIVHAIRNHEADYTGEIDDVMVELGDDYSPEEVRAVLKTIEQ
jgi:hypothetical protein